MTGASLGWSHRFLEAFAFAVKLHGQDVRKGSQVPYVAHVLGVCALVLYDGGSETEAIAALLHDALEDHPEVVSREMIGERFGADVLAIVAACTDTPSDYKGGPKPPWRQRKEAYLERMRTADPRIVRVALADKLDNARIMLADLKQVGDSLWSRFRVGKEEQLWFYRSAIAAFREAGAVGFLIDALEEVVRRLEEHGKAG